MKKKILLGAAALIAAGVVLWLVLYLPMTMELSACLGKDHAAGAKACPKLLARSQYSGKDAARVFALLKYAGHLMPLGRRGEAPPVLQEARQIAGLEGVFSIENERTAAMNQTTLMLWAFHMLEGRRDLAMQAMSDGKRRSSAKTLQVQRP